MGHTFSFLLLFLGLAIFALLRRSRLGDFELEYGGCGAFVPVPNIDATVHFYGTERRRAEYASLIWQDNEHTWTKGTWYDVVITSSRRAASSMGWKLYGSAKLAATGLSEIRKPFGWICGLIVAARTALAL